MGPLHRCLPYRHFIESCLLLRESPSEILDRLRLFRLPMPDGIEGLIEACRDDLYGRSKGLDNFLSGRSRKPPLDFIREHVLRDTAFLEGDQRATGPVHLIAASTELRRLVEALALKLAMQDGGLPGELKPQGLEVLRECLQDQTGLAFSVADIARYLYFFADVEEMSWLEWTRFFDSVPDSLYALYRLIPERLLGEIKNYVTRATATGVATMINDQLQRRVLNLVAEQFSGDPASQIRMSMQALGLVARLMEHGDKPGEKEVQAFLASLTTKDVTGNMRSVAELQAENEALDVARKAGGENASVEATSDGPTAP